MIETSKLSAALVKEFLAAHDMKMTLAAFNKESKINCISSRKELAHTLHLTKQIVANKAKGRIGLLEQPLQSFLEIFVEHVSKKLQSRKSSVTNHEMLNKEASQIEMPPGPAANNQSRLTARDVFNPELLKRVPSLPTKAVAKNMASDIQIIDDLVLSDDDGLTLSIAKPTVFELQEIGPTLNKDLVSILFPTNATQRYQSSWLGKGFWFRDGVTGYGLIQSEGGPCGLIAAVQSHILKHLVYGSVKSVRNNQLRPTINEKSAALTEALCDIIWNAGGRKRACLVLSLGQLKGLLVSEGLGYLQLSNKKALTDALNSRIHEFMHHDGSGNGYIQLLLSAILSRTIPNLKKDMDDYNTSLMGQHAYCTQDMVNLLLYGKATSNLHDGDIDVDGTLIKGIKSDCEIGQLSLFEYYQNLTVGKFAKNPEYPIFVICSESHYSVLFSLNRPVPSSHITLQYYDSLANQSEEIILTLTPNSNVVDDRSLKPPIELCLTTKWGPSLKVDWNGTEPLL